MVLEHDYSRYPELTNTQLEEIGFTSPHPQYTQDFEAVVEKVTDGDTITLSTSDRDFLFPLRLLDIDAPEMNDGGEVAKDWLEGQILGQKVTIHIDRNQRVGKYGRLLGKVIFAGMDMGQSMLSMGLVSEFGKKNEANPEPLDKVFRPVVI